MKFDSFFEMLANLAHQDWVMRTLIGLAIILVTWFVARMFSRILRNMLEKGRGPLPKNSIFLNLIKFFVWVIGISILLGVCFNINLSAILTALGVGGIAVSLGFQATLSNLIGGLEVSISRIVVPGDNVQIGAMNLRGIVKDVTWRHTTISDYSGNEIIVPNSVMNTQSLVKLQPRNYVTIPLSLSPIPTDLKNTAALMEQAAKAAVGSAFKFTKEPTVLYTEIGDTDVKGSISFVIDNPDNASAAIDVCVRAIAPYAIPNTSGLLPQQKTDEIELKADAVEPETEIKLK